MTGRAASRSATADAAARSKDGPGDVEESSAPPPDVLAAGAVVLRRVGDTRAGGGEGSDARTGGRRPRPGTGVEVLLVHRPRLDDWSVPKGKLEDAEHPLVAAVREVAEETGVTGALGRRLPSAHYRVGGTLHKEVRYWTATVAASVEHVADDEVDEVRWVELRDAARLATHRWDRRMLSSLAGSADAAHAVVAVPPVVLVRHAKAVARKNWTGDDRRRPLSADGERQALSLVPLLATFAPGRVLTSPSTRCRQTVQPFTRSTSRPLTAAPQLTEESFAADPDAAHAVVDELLAGRGAGDAPVLVCTHRPVLDAVLHRLTDGRVSRRLAPGEVAVLTGTGPDLRVDRYPVPG